MSTVSDSTTSTLSEPTLTVSSDNTNNNTNNNTNDNTNDNTTDHSTDQTTDMNTESLELKLDRTLYYRTIVHETNEVRKRRFRGRNKRLMRSEHNEQIFNAINDLTNDILDGWRAKVSRAAQKGYFSANIYEFYNGSTYRDFPIILLMKGPKNEPDFFEENGMFSVFEEVQSEISAEGFRTSMKYVGKGKTVLMVDWRAGLYDN